MSGWGAAPSGEGSGPQADFGGSASGWGAAPKPDSASGAGGDGWGAPALVTGWAADAGADGDGWGGVQTAPQPTNDQPDGWADAGGGWGDAAATPASATAAGSGWGSAAAAPTPVEDGWGSLGPEVPAAEADTNWAARLGSGGGGGGGGGNEAIASMAVTEVGWGDAPSSADGPTLTLDKLGDEDSVGDSEHNANNSSAPTVSRTGSGAWLNPLNTPTPRDASSPPPPSMRMAGQSDTLAKMGSILNTLASGTALPGGQRPQADAFKLAQAREEKKRRKSTLSYKLRKQLFSPKLLRTYFVLALAAQVTLGVLFFMIQQVLQEDLMFLLILMAFTMEGGMVIGQGKDHFSIDKQGYKLKDDDSPTAAASGPDSSRDEMRQQTQREYKLRRKLKWHGKMIAYPMLTMAFSSFVYIFGSFQVVLGKMNDQSIVDASGEPICDKGPINALSYMGAREFALLFLNTLAIGGVLLTQTMLTITHHRCYTKLARKSEQTLDPVTEQMFPLLYGRRVYWCYMLSVFAQAIFYITLSFARQEAGMPELGFAFLWGACYVWGWQINMLDDYNFHTSFPEFEICKTRERLRWHGRKIFVVIFALLGNFWLYCIVWMAIIPFYFDYKVQEANGLVICPKTVGEMLRDMKGSAWGYILFTGFMLCVMAVIMSFLSHLHFFAFKDFCKKDSADIGTSA
jgi:hypothetical protein